MKWIRLYAKVAHDPKVQQLPGPLFKFWINLLCLTGEAEEKRGSRENRCPKIHQIAWNLRLREKLTKKLLQQLCERRLIEQDEEGYKIHDWEEYQYDSDSSTERVQRFRERSRNVTETRETAKSSSSIEQNRVEESNELPPAAALPLPLSEIIPFAAAACRAAPNPARSQAEKALLLRQNDIRAARNPEGLALIILRDFGINPPPPPKKNAPALDEYNQLVEEISRQRKLPR